MYLEMRTLKLMEESNWGIESHFLFKPSPLTLALCMWSHYSLWCARSRDGHRDNKSKPHQSTKN
jgi:hypothetical protein